MGPRASARGRARFRIRGVDMFGLQWGRARVRAEGPCTVPPVPPGPSCFNGAARECARKAPQRERTTRRDSPLQWGRARVRAEGDLARAGTHDRQPLQWGRARVRAEGHPTPPAPLGRRCFNGAARECARKVWWATDVHRWAFASMGPRASARGRPAGSADDRIHPRASMGPRASARGRALWRLVLQFSSYPLQWGRARVRAEGRMDQIIVNRIVKLQWGRARVRAEGRQRVGVGLPVQEASMGPRASARGRSPHRTAHGMGGLATVFERCVGTDHSDRGDRSFRKSNPSCQRHFECLLGSVRHVADRRLSIPRNAVQVESTESPGPPSGRRPSGSPDPGRRT